MKERSVFFKKKLKIESHFSIMLCNIVFFKLQQKFLSNFQMARPASYLKGGFGAQLLLKTPQRKKGGEREREELISGAVRFDIG